MQPVWAKFNSDIMQPVWTKTRNEVEMWLWFHCHSGIFIMNIPVIQVREKSSLLKVSNYFSLWGARVCKSSKRGWNDFFEVNFWELMNKLSASFLSNKNATPLIIHHISTRDIQKVSCIPHFTLKTKVASDFSMQSPSINVSSISLSNSLCLLYRSICRWIQNIQGWWIRGWSLNCSVSTTKFDTKFLNSFESRKKSEGIKSGL